MFEVAWFWRLDPATMMALPLSEAMLYEQQADRLARTMSPQE